MLKLQEGRTSINHTINLIIMTKMIRAQLPKYVVGAMVDVNMNSMPSKVMGGRLVYELKVFLSYQKILNPKGI